MTEKERQKLEKQKVRTKKNSRQSVRGTKKQSDEDRNSEIGRDIWETWEEKVRLDGVDRQTGRLCK